MSIRFNATKKELQLSVGDLLWIERRQDTRSGAGIDAAALGRLAHKMQVEKQAERHDNYQTEVELSAPFSVDQYKIQISGRIDGLWQEQNVTFVEEIKTILGQQVPIQQPSHQMQCALYVWLYHKIHQTPTRGSLTLYHYPTGRIESIDLHPDLKALEKEITRRLRIILHHLETEDQRLQRRKRSARTLRYPFPEYRRGQREMEETVERTLKSNRNLMLEAPPGSGKTAPILFAALQFCLRNGYRLAFATSRKAQQYDRVHLLEQMASPVTLGRCLLMGPLDEVCPRHLDNCPTNPRRTESFDLFDPPDWFVKLIGARTIITPSIVRETGEKMDFCGQQLQREIAQRADLLIGDQNLLVEPEFHPGGWFSYYWNQGKTVLLVDEAHGLPDRLRQRRAAKISLAALKYLAGAYQARSSLLARGIASRSQELIFRIEGKLRPDTEIEPPRFELMEADDPDLVEIIQQLALCFLSESVQSDRWNPEKPENQLISAAVATQHPDCMTAYLNREKAEIGWELIEPGELLQSRWKECTSTIAFSATLQPFDFMMKELGFSQINTDCFQAPSPFPAENLKIIRYTGINTTYQRRHEYFEKLANLLERTAMTTAGNWLVFFPSYAYLKSVRLQMESPEIKVVEHTPNLPSQLASRLLPEKHAPTLHLMVLGGAYSEGVGWVDNDLDGIAVIGPGLPPMTPNRELLRYFWDEEQDNGFLRAYVLPGLIRVIQAAGRLIRHENQTGLLLLIGQRFANPAFTDYLPESWQSSAKTGNLQVLLEMIKKAVGLPGRLSDHREWANRL